MSNYWSKGDASLLLGDVREMLGGMEDESVQCVVTSPPYWGLRSYGIDPVVWGGDAGCEHEWGDERTLSRPRQHLKEFGETSGYGGGAKHSESAEHFNGSLGQFCSKCGAWLGCLGLEPTPDMFVSHLVEVFRELRRVLRGDGVVWLNLGDSYANDMKWGGSTGGKHRSGLHGNTGVGRAKRTTGLKPKDLCGIPWRVALALQADGWYLRSGIPWVKRNAMPESVTDRPATAHEYVFLLSKSKSYFYDRYAVMGECASGASDIKKMVQSLPRIGGKHTKLADPLLKASSVTNIGEKRSVGDPSGRNRRTSDWFNESIDAAIEEQTRYLAHLQKMREDGGMLLDAEGDPLALLINLQGYKGAHFATFPPKLVLPMVKASVSERGACLKCGTPWKRIVDKGEADREWQKACGGNAAGEYNGAAIKDYDGTGAENPSEVKARILEGMRAKRTVGWEPGCSCEQAETTACVVLDPFNGSGTTGEVALGLGCKYIGIDAKAEYLDLSIERLNPIASQPSLGLEAS